MDKTKVCIVGAGPAGALTALFLAKKGIDCILLDKTSFPRDKICGDGISGWVLWVLQQLDPQLLQKLNNEPFLVHSYGIRVVAPNYKYLDLPFYENPDGLPGIPPGYICKRYDFDRFLIDAVKTKKEITLMENTEIIGWQKNTEECILESKDGRLISSQLVVFANGATSKFMKDPGGIHKNKRYTMTGIMTYYKGVSGTHEKNFVELHFLKELLPGYLWIFPLPNGEANVGVGLDQHRISRKKINLKKVMFDAIETVPSLKARFATAEQTTPVQAYGLPLWDKRRKLSGERYLLAGDAASLIDPVTGEGIGHAALSGMYAAAQAERCINSENFSEEGMNQYDDELYAKIGRELIISKNIPKFIRHDWIFNAIVNKATKSKSLQEKLKLAMTDLEVRKKLKEPSLYLKVLLGL